MPVRALRGVPGGEGPFARATSREVLAERGRTDEALQLFSSFSAVSVYDLAYLAPAHLERARLLDSQGDEWAAASEYQRVIELWQDPDPELPAY